MSSAATITISSHSDPYAFHHIHNECKDHHERIMVTVAVAKVSVLVHTVCMISFRCISLGFLNIHLCWATFGNFMGPCVKCPTGWMNLIAQLLNVPCFDEPTLLNKPYSNCNGFRLSLPQFKIDSHSFRRVFIWYFYPHPWSSKSDPNPTSYN